MVSDGKAFPIPRALEAALHHKHLNQQQKPDRVAKAPDRASNRVCLEVADQIETGAAGAQSSKGRKAPGDFDHADGTS